MYLAFQYQSPSFRFRKFLKSHEQERLPFFKESLLTVSDQEK